MVGKFVFFAFHCVFLTQIQGNELENAIKNGINKLKGLHQEGEKRFEAANKEIDDKTLLTESKSSNFIMTFESINDKIQQTLENRAQNFEEKAKEENKSERALKCIQENEETANNNSTTLMNKFKTQIKHLEKVQLKNIKANTQLLNEVQIAMTGKYKRAIKVIEYCKNPTCVTVITKSIVIRLDQLFEEIKKILDQIATGVGNFDRDAFNYFTDCNHQISKIQSSTLKNFRNCVLRENGI